MVLVSQINIDLGAQNAVLTASVGVNVVDGITYDNITKQLTLVSKPGVSVNFADFLSFCDQVNIFQTAILFNYATNVFLTTPFSKITTIEFHDTGLGNWNLTVSPLAGSNVVDYTGTHGTQNMSIAKRPNPVILSFPEWIYFLQQLNHYRLSIKAF